MRVEYNKWKKEEHVAWLYNTKDVDTLRLKREELFNREEFLLVVVD